MYRLTQNKKESQKLAYIVTITISVSASIGIGTALVYIVSCTAEDNPNCDIPNWLALALEGVIFAGGLGSFFYYLQVKNNKKIESILTQINERETARKQFWLNVADKILFIIHNDLRNLESYYEIVLNQSPDEERLKSIEELINQDKFRALNHTLPELNSAMSQIADLLDDNALFRDANPAYFSWLIETANVRLPAHNIENAMSIIEVRMQDIDLLRERLKKEMPSKHL